MHRFDRVIFTNYFHVSFMKTDQTFYISKLKPCISVCLLQHEAWKHEKPRQGAGGGSQSLTGPLWRHLAATSGRNNNMWEPPTQTNHADIIPPKCHTHRTPQTDKQPHFLFCNQKNLKCWVLICNIQYMNNFSELYTLQCFQLLYLC